MKHDVCGLSFSGIIYLDDSIPRSPVRQCYAGNDCRAARWHYDFIHMVYGFCFWLLLLNPLWVGIATAIFSVIGLCSKEEKTRLFIFACFLNGFALFPTFLMFLTMLGSVCVWSWVRVMPILAFGLLICVLLSFLIIILTLVLFRKQNNSRPWQSFLYQVLTFVHSLLALNWLFMFMPDA